MRKTLISTAWVATLEKMESIRRERDLVLVHPYNDPRIIAGQGAVGLEVAQQLPTQPTASPPPRSTSD